MQRFRWGILGSGFAARKFVLGLRAAREAEVVLVASRSAERAREFAQAFRVPRAFESYEAAARSGLADAFYVATPPSAHRSHALLCIDAGKPVLVEKPFATNAAAARDIVEAAKKGSLFCMEAMWTRFLPLVRRLKRMVDEGTLGEVRMLTGSLGSAEVSRPDNPLFNLEVGGGAMLDRGIYPLSLAFHLLGRPDEILSQAILGPTGVDEDASVILRYARGALAQIGASLRTQASNDCLIMGTDAQVHVHAPIYRPFRMTVTPIRPRDRGRSRPSRQEAFRESHWAHTAYQRFGRFASAALDGSRVQYSEWYDGNGYHYQAQEVMACVRAGRPESEIMPLAQSLSIMEAMDQIRLQWRGEA